MAEFPSELVTQIRNQRITNEGLVNGYEQSLRNHDASSARYRQAIIDHGNASQVLLDHDNYIQGIERDLARTVVRGSTTRPEAGTTPNQIEVNTNEFPNRQHAAIEGREVRNRLRLAKAERDRLRFDTEARHARSIIDKHYEDELDKYDDMEDARERLQVGADILDDLLERRAGEVLTAERRARFLEGLASARGGARDVGRPTPAELPSRVARSRLN